MNVRFNTFPKKLFLKGSSFQLLFVGILSFLLSYYVVLSLGGTLDFSSSYRNILFLWLFLLLFLLTTWLLTAFILFKKYPEKFLPLSCLALSPWLILGLLLPYYYIPASHIQPHPLFPLLLITLCQIILLRVLQEDSGEPLALRPPHRPVFLIVFVILYALGFSAIVITQYHSFQNFNSQDLGLYNQIMWNNLRGHFFESSASGSNFVTHNSPFWLLLTPFYAVWPSPEMLLFLKSAFLAFSAFPLYLIAKKILEKNAALILTCGFMFYPFFAAQNLAAPHEVCFLPFFLLFAFYFFQQEQFGKFMLFLLLSLFVKEHIALVAIAFGVYAFFQKRKSFWVAAPIVLGVAWGIFSLWIMHHFQQIYHIDKDPAWLIENIKNRFLRLQNNTWTVSPEGWKTANLTHWFNLTFVYQLVSPLAIFLPFLSPLFLLGMPELIINLLSDRLIFFPMAHYHLVVSCFLFVSTIASFQKLSDWLPKNLKISRYAFQKILCTLTFFSIISHYILWVEEVKIIKNPLYVQTMKEALRIIPRNVSVSVPEQILCHVSSRPDYFNLADKRFGEYILTTHHYIDTEENALKEILNKDYRRVFSKDGIEVFRRNER